MALWVIAFMYLTMGRPLSLLFGLAIFGLVSWAAAFEGIASEGGIVSKVIIPVCGIAAGIAWFFPGSSSGVWWWVHRVR